MSRGGTKLAWAFLIALACVAGWLVLDGGPSPELPPPAAVADAPARQAPPAEPLRESAAAPGTAPLPVEGDVGQPPAAAPAPAVKALPTEPLWQPAYGDALRRGGGRAMFALVDAQGAGLDSPRVSVMLYRALGPYWLREHAEFNTESGVVECIGHSSVGLEPGEYELEVHDARYGNLRHRFTLARGQQLEQTLRLPNWRRIVTFRFVDQHGQPVHWIHRLPSVISATRSWDLADRTRAPARVLRYRPSWVTGGEGGLAGFRSGGQGEKRTVAPFVVATDNGYFYVEVFAGSRYEVQFPLEESLWGITTRHFSDPNQGTHEVVCTLVADFDQQVTQMRKELVDDPGNRSLLIPREQPQASPETDDLKSISDGKVRLVVRLQAPAAVRPIVHYSYDFEGTPVVGTVDFVLRDNAWVADAPADQRLMLHFTDGALFESAGEEVDPQGRSLIEIQRTLTRTGFAISPRESPPTVDAWALDQLQEVTNPAANRDSAPVRFTARDNHVLCSPERQAELAGAARLRVSTLLAGPRGFTKHRIDLMQYLLRPTLPRRPSPEDWMHPLVQSNRMELPGTVLVSGSFCPPAPQTGIAFRAIGPLGEGLPWVEASLLSLEEDQIAQAVREHEAAETRDHARPRVSVVPYEYHSRLDDAVADEDAPLTDVLPHLPEGMRGRLKARPELLWYARNGTWYSTHRKFRSDDHGYVVNTQPRLTPGTRYVLYLWSNSRDDMSPDRRIVFEAAPGLTDLGAIPLPSYSQ